MGQKPIEMGTFRQLAADESGLTMIELLVVMLVVAILATIAIPAFGEQASKAHDARAKQTAAAAATAMETCRVATLLGGYDECNANTLRALDPSLPPNPTLKTNGLAYDKYQIVVQSEPSSQKFRIKRNNNGALSFPCVKKGVAGCPADGDWGD